MPLRIGVIGLGHWGPHHVRIFSALRGSVVVAAADKSRDRLRTVLAANPAVRLESDGGAICRARDIDAVVVATPTTTHAKLVREALNHGKHVLCEKPFCIKSSDGRGLVDLARRKKRILMVGHVFLFNPGLVKVRGMLRAGRLGAVRYLSATRTNLGPIRGDANVSYDLASHDISIFNWLLGGTPRSVSATGGRFLRPGLHDVVFATLHYPKNRIAHVHVSWIDPRKVRRITIVGSEKMVTWDDLRLTTPVAVYDRGAEVSPTHDGYGEYLRVSMWDGDVRLPKIEHAEPLRTQARAFLKAVRSGKVERAGGRFGVDVVRVLEAVNASLKKRGATVRVR